MFISTTRIFALVAVLASSTFALPEGGLDRREAAEVNRVKLQVGEFMGVESPAKSDSIKGWGGIGDRFWNFAFQGTYNKENYVYTLYKKEGTWDSNDASPNQPVNKKFDCVIESAAGTGTVTLLDVEPWAKKEGAGVKTATCTVKT